MGEHDYYLDLGKYWSELFGDQYYSWDHKGVHFIVLNSCVDMSPSSEQYQWLVADLGGIDASSEFRIVVFHHPLHSTGRHGGEDTLEQLLSPLFEQHNQ